jgi:hypothetical protein
MWYALTWQVLNFSKNQDVTQYSKTELIFDSKEQHSLRWPNFKVAETKESMPQRATQPLTVYFSKKRTSESKAKFT